MISINALALLPMPYGYYVLLRWMMVFSCAYIISTVFKSKNNTGQSIFLLGLIAVIYNPIFPLHLGRPIWTAVNLATIAVIVLCIRRLPKNKFLL
jgi:hypothetical protein